MATRSTIYAERPDGTWVGSYCHYDGYPTHMVTHLREIKVPEAFHILVFKAAMSGGIRSVRLVDGSCKLETFSDRHGEVYRSGYKIHEEYAYRVYKDGTISYAHYHYPERWYFDQSDYTRLDERGKPNVLITPDRNVVIPK